MRFRTITATVLAAVGLGLAGCEAGSGPTDPQEYHANTVLVNGVRLVRVAPGRGLTSAGGDSDEKSRLVIAGASDLGNDWRFVGEEYDPSADAVDGEIEYFSKYALALE